MSIRIDFIGHLDAKAFARDVGDTLTELKQHPRIKGEPLVKYDHCATDSGYHYTALLITEIDEE